MGGSNSNQYESVNFPNNGVQVAKGRLPGELPEESFPKNFGRSLFSEQTYFHQKMMLSWREVDFMKSLWITFLLSGILLSGVFSCATVSQEPLSTGEVRLLSLVVPEKEKTKVRSPFVANIKFEADGSPEIKEACFFFSGNGPRCFNVTDANYVSPGNIRVQISTSNAGSRLLECYVVYIRDGKVHRTNTVKTYFNTTPP